MKRFTITHVRREAVRGKSIRHIDISGLDVGTLERSGWDVSEVGDGRLDPGTTDVVCVIGNAAWFPKLFRQLAATPAAQRPLIVIRHDEPLPPPPASGLPTPGLTWRERARILRRDHNATDCYSNARFLRWLSARSLPDLLVVSSPGQQEYLAAHHIASEFVPEGWRDSYGDDLGLPRTVDVLSLGTHQSSRRRGVIASLCRQGIAVSTAGDYFDPHCYGDDRTRLLNRTKILLNVLRDPGLSLGQSRLTLGMANGALVISEPLYRPDPFVPGLHYVSATAEEMPAAIRYFLTHDTERQAVVTAAYRHVLTDVTEVAATDRILGLIRERLTSDRHLRATACRRTPTATNRETL